MSSQEVTRLMSAISQGQEDANDQLIRLLYTELRRLAGALMRNERSGHTLQPTALVHEAFLRLFDGEANWQNRAHFFGAAAQAMRRILIEHARKRAAAKRGGLADRVPLEDQQVFVQADPSEMLALDEALTALAQLDPRLTRIVELRYFTGCSVEETAELIGVSAATIKRDWSYARAWLYDRIQGRAQLEASASAAS
jgi:RNA polymerase sigma factor (TIGR02999 family)